MLLAARDRADFGEDDPIGFTGDELRGWAMDEPGLATDAWIALRGDEIVGPEAPAGTMIRDYRPGDEDAELHAMHQEAFAGQWEFTPSPLDKLFRQSPLRLGA